MERMTNANTGDVFQIVHGGTEDTMLARWPHFRGLLVYADEVKNWGIVAVVMSTHRLENGLLLPLRLQWDEIEYVGTPKIIPEGVGR